MADNMAIGPAVTIGGNKVQMEVKPRFVVTDKKGDTKTFSADEFEKQILLNADKFEKGKDFEFKKDRKALKIAAAIVGTAAVVTGVIYYKKIGQFFNKLFRKLKPNKNNSNIKLRTVFDGELTPARNKNEAITARETLKMKNQATADIAENIVNYIEKLKMSEKGGVHNSRQKMYERIFKEK